MGIILTPDIRSKAYLRKILDYSIKLDEIIFLNDKKSEKIFSKFAIRESRKCGFDVSESVLDILLENKINFKEFDYVDINNLDLNNYLKKSKINYFIFTGGGILGTTILNSGPKFIHFHPGIIPDYRGSTCFYYSIINEDKCGVTCFIMDEKLDTGSIVFQKNFPLPNHSFIDEVYDPYIRAETLKEVLQNKLLEKENFREQKPEEGETYFVIHPVLKHISMLSYLQ